MRAMTADMKRVVDLMEAGAVLNYHRAVMGCPPSWWLDAAPGQTIGFEESRVKQPTANGLITRGVLQFARKTSHTTSIYELTRSKP